MILSHLRANAVSYLALAVALSTGTAYAAGAIADGSVTTVKLAKNAVTSSKIAKGGVKSADVKDNSLSAKDVKDGSLTSADVHDGTLTKADLAAGVLPAELTFSGETEGGNPAAAPELANNRSFAFTTGGQTYIQFAYNTVGVTCSAGSGRMGLYVDGVPVPKTSYLLPSAASPGAVSLSAVVTTAPGAHTASIGIDCPSGNNVSATHTDSRWFVLATKA